MKKYYPLLISRKGEIVALQHLKQGTKDHVCPVIQIVDDSLEKSVTEKSGSSKIVYKDELENFLKTHWIFFGNEIILDFSEVTNVDTKIELVKKMLASLINAGVNIIPAIYRTMPTAFAEMLKTLINKHKLNICLRTTERTDGFDNFKINTEKLVAYFGLDLKRILILWDIGYTKHDRCVTLKDLVTNAIKSLDQKVNEWHCVIVASSSFPENLGDFKPTNNPNLITRYEWKTWKSIITDTELKDIKYGDFGTKFHHNEEVTFGGTISVKYSIESDYVIYRGKLTTEHVLGHKQYISHAINLVKSKYYLGKDFSWGDKRIMEMSMQDIASDKCKPGSPTVWVQISQNHHIELINSLL